MRWEAESGGPAGDHFAGFLMELLELGLDSSRIQNSEPQSGRLLCNVCVVKAGSRLQLVTGLGRHVQTPVWLGPGCIAQILCLAQPDFGDRGQIGCGA